MEEKTPEGKHRLHENIRNAFEKIGRDIGIPEENIPEFVSDMMDYALSKSPSN